MKIEREKRNDIQKDAKNFLAEKIEGWALEVNNSYNVNFKLIELKVKDFENGLEFGVWFEEKGEAKAVIITLWDDTMEFLGYDEALNNLYDIFCEKLGTDEVISLDDVRLKSFDLEEAKENIIKIDKMLIDLLELNPSNKELYINIDKATDELNKIIVTLLNDNNINHNEYLEIIKVNRKEERGE